MPLAGARERRRLELGDLRRLPRAARRQPRRERRVHRRPLRAAPLRDGRRSRSATRPTPAAARRHGAAAARVDRRRRPRLLDHAVEHALRRRRPAGAVAVGQSHDEVSALCAAVGEHEGTTLEGIVDGCLDQFDDDEIDLLVDDVGRGAAGRSTGTCSRSTPACPSGCRASSRRRRRAPRSGGRIVALTMPVLVPDEHELPQLLRAVTCCRVGSEILGLPGARAHGASCATPRRAGR